MDTDLPGIRSLFPAEVKGPLPGFFAGVWAENY